MRRLLGRTRPRAVGLPGASAVKKPRRRPAKKVHPKQPQIDDDLAELASVLDEYQRDKTSQGWLSVPWRSGWNAVLLALDLSDRLDDGSDIDARHFLRDVLAKRRDAGAYWEANEHLQSRPSDLITAALRCLQVTISNSSGGGEVFNVILGLALREFHPVLIEPSMLEWRCWDALGTGPTLQADAMDRRRRAFKIAWERGLFLAAYAIKPKES
jgi:hypothetical protein